MGKVSAPANINYPERGAAVQQYRWKAVDSSGVSRSGVYSAASEFEAAAFVRSNYGYLTLLQQEKPASAMAKKQGLFKFSKTKNSLTDEEKTVFFSQLALMLNSGLPLLKSLGVLAERLPPKTAQLCLGIERDLKMGTSFAGCIKNRQEVWGALPAAVAEAGENGGILCEMLEELAEYYKLQVQMKRFLKNISLYPLFLFSASLATAVLFIVQVLPLFKDLYASMNAQLPPYLKLLFAVQEFLAANMPAAYILLSALLVIAAARRRQLLELVFKVPFFKAQKELYLEIRFNKVLALLLHGGIPLPQAAQIAGSALGDAGLCRRAEVFAADVLRGVNTAEAALKAKPLFGSLSAEFIGVGAETGRLPEMLMRAAEILQYRFDDTLKNLKTVLEPLLLTVAAGVVSAVILAVAAPMFSLSGALPGF